jgi:hypothetical protein
MRLTRTTKFGLEVYRVYVRNVLVAEFLSESAARTYILTRFK